MGKLLSVGTFYLLYPITSINHYSYKAFAYFCLAFDLVNNRVMSFYLELFLIMTLLKSILLSDMKILFGILLIINSVFSMNDTILLELFGEKTWFRDNQPIAVTVCIFNFNASSLCFPDINTNSITSMRSTSAAIMERIIPIGVEKFNSPPLKIRFQLE